MSWTVQVSDAGLVAVWVSLEAWQAREGWRADPGRNAGDPHGARLARYTIRRVSSVKVHVSMRDRRPGQASIRADGLTKGFQRRL